MLLFAYASNMNVDKFKETVPSAKKVAVAKLPGYKFGFTLASDDGSSKASLMPSTDADALAWGVLIDIDDKEKGNFFFDDDWFEFKTVNCFDEDDKLHKAEAFVTLPHAVNNFLLPYDWYHAKILKYAKDAGLPESYLTMLSLLPCKVDPDEKRRARRIANT